MRLNFPLFPKKKFLFGTLIMVALMMSGSSVVLAQGVPNQLHYQGRLLDNNGNLLGGAGTDYCFRFGLYDDAVVGAPDNQLWPSATPSDMTVSVVNGVFAVGIGDTSVGGDTLDFNFSDTDEVYVNVEVATQVGGSCGGGDETYETLSPRQRILSAGYAINSGSVFGTNQSAIGTTNPFENAQLTVQATSTTGIPLVIQRIAGQVANLFEIFTEAAESIFSIGSNGNVGIGSSTPSTKLVVSGEVTAASFIATTTATSTFTGGIEADVLNITSTIATSSFANGINIATGCIAVGGACLNPNAASTYLDLTDTPSSFTANALQFVNSGGTALTQNALLVFDGNNLGVGTSSPFAPLTVEGDTYFSGDVTSTGTVSALGSGTSTFSGAVGIGTTSAADTLEIGSGFIGFSNNGGGLQVRGSDQNSLIFRNETDRILRLLNFDDGWVDNQRSGFFQLGAGYGFFTGNNGVVLERFGISATGTVISNEHYGSLPAPTGILHIQPDDATPDTDLLNLVGVSAQTADYINVTSDGGTEGDILTVTSNGLLGVGSGTPAYLLDVVNDDGAASARIYGGSGSGSTRAQLIFDRTNDARGGGIRIRATQSGSAEWWAGVPYNGGSASDAFTIGRHATQPEYATNAYLSIAQSGVTTLNQISVSTTTATSSFANGINLSDGCFSLNGSCLGGSSVDTLDDLSDVDTTNVASGALLQYTGSQWATTTLADFNTLSGLGSFGSTTATTTAEGNVHVLENLQVGSGSVFINDTGITGSGALALVTGSGGNFSVNADALVIDGTTGFIGIGSSTPSQALSVEGDVIAGSFIATTTQTSIFTGDISTDLVTVSSTTATSTFANGIAISTGCVSVNGNCLSSSADFDTFAELDTIVSDKALANLNDTQTFDLLTTFTSGLDIQASTTLSSDTGDALASYLNFEKTQGGGGIASGDELGAIRFSGFDNSTFNLGASIEAVSEGTIVVGQTPTSLRFSTEDNDGNFAERFRITADGNIGIGTTSPYELLGVAGTVVANRFNATATNATSTFEGLEANLLTVTATNASSSFANGIDITEGCFSINGVCTTANVSYTGLTDTPSTLTVNAIQYADGSGSAITQSGSFTFNGTLFTAPQTTLTGELNAQSGFVSRASSTVDGNLTVTGSLGLGVVIADSTTATSTFANGIQLTGGCFEGPDGSCLQVSNPVIGQFKLSTASDGGNINSGTATSVPFDVTVREDSGITHPVSDNPARIQLDEIGWYRVTYQIAGDNTNTGTTRANTGCELRQNGGVVTGSHGYGYTRGAADDQVTMNGSVIIETTAVDEYIEVFCQGYGVTTITVNVVGDETQINIEKIGGVLGGGGSGGGGGSLVVQEEDTTILSTASTLDFGGSDFAVVNSGGGEVDIDIDYTNSGITRGDVAEIITEEWNFAGGASSTGFSIFGTVAVGNSATTTIVGDNGTSTFAGGIETDVLNITSTVASSSFANGIEINAGCVLLNGSCLGSNVTYLSLADTPNSFTTNAIPFANSAGTALTQDPNFVFDAANERLGIGVGSNPQGIIDLYSESATDIIFESATNDTTGADILLRKSQEGGGTISGDSVGATRFQAFDGLSYNNAATIEAITEGTILLGQTPTSLRFSTEDLSGDYGERLRITPTGNLGVGTTTPPDTFTVEGHSFFSGNLTATGTLTIHSTTASSSFANGLDLSGGCFAINGTCLGSSAVENMNDLIDVDTAGVQVGDLLSYNGSTWVDTATSTLQIALADTTGTLAATRGGTGLSTITEDYLIIGGAGNTFTQVATTSLGLITTDITEGTNLYWTDTRFDDRLMASTTVVNLNCATGQVAKANGLGSWNCDNDVAGGGGGSGLWATSTGSDLQHPTDTGRAVVIGASATSTTGNIFEVSGSSLFDAVETEDALISGTITVTGQGEFSYSSSTGFSSLDSFYIGRNATTTIRGDSGTSTFQNGISITEGCFEVAGTCFVSATDVALNDITDVDTTNVTIGDLLQFQAGGWATTSTSTLNIDLADTSGTLGVAQGGTGVTTFVQGFLYGDGTNAIVSSSSPTVGVITATSLVASSTFQNGIEVENGCVAVNGNCLTATDAYTDLTDTPSSLLANAIQYVNSAGTAIEQVASFVYDSVGGRLGIGEANPEYILHTASSTDGSVLFEDTSSDTDAANIILRKSRGVGAVQNGDELGSIQFTGFDLGGNTVGASIGVVTEDAIAVGQMPSGIRFSTDNIGETLTERMRIAANGNVGIGTTSPFEKLSVAGGIVANFINATATNATSTFSGGLAANLLNITATNATSTFANGIALTNGCISANGVCIGSEYTALTDTPTTITANAIQFGNAGGNAITQSASFTFDGTRLTTPELQVNGEATTTGRIVVQGSGSSTFAGPIEAEGLYVRTGTSTFENGINVTGGCIAFNGQCIATEAIDGVTITTFTGNGTWTKADYSGLSFTKAIVTAGGGGGGGANGTDTTTEQAATGGGAGGTTIEMLAEADLGATESITVGTGGTGGTGNAAGSNGNASQFGAGPLLSANGGTGGGQSSGGGTCNADPQLGVGGTAQTNGDINLAGGDGSTGSCDGEQASGGTGGASYWGGGGGGADPAEPAAENGKNGNAYGSGGGGAAVGDVVSAVTGGSGADGIVVTYNYTSSGGDLAEFYETKADVEAGDVVAISQDNFEYDSKLGLQSSAILEKAGSAETVVGVVSHAPYTTMGLDILGKAENPQPIALAGRVPVKVSMENGEIKAGDLLTLSSVEGVAMRSTKAGVTLGRALEDSNCDALEDGEHCMVLVMVNTSYSTGALIKVAYRDNGLLLDEIAPENIAIDTGRALLAQMLQDKKDIVEEVNLSEIFTDRLVAGLELVAPRVVTDELVVNTIELVDGDLNIKLDNGQTFTINNEDAVSIDALGNAMFAGTLSAQNFEIGSENIPGGITMYDRVSKEPFCVMLEAGELVKIPGKCGEVQLAGLFDSLDNARDDSHESQAHNEPQLRLVGNNPAVLELGSTYADPGIVIESVEDQNLGVAYTVNGNEVDAVTLDTQVEAEYQITYTVTRQDGTASSLDRIVYIGIDPNEDPTEEVVVIEEEVEQSEDPVEEEVTEEIVEEPVVIEEGVVVDEQSEEIPSDLPDGEAGVAGSEDEVVEVESFDTAQDDSHESEVISEVIEAEDAA